MNKLKADTQLMIQIARRALPLYREFDGSATRLDLLMDLHYAHAVIPLRLSALLKAPESDFVHDISGLYVFFDRNTKTFKDHFTPRFAQ